MTAADLLDRARLAGVTVTVQDGRLRVAGRAGAVRELVPALEASKAGILALLTQQGGLTPDQEGAIRAWLAHIGETDQALIAGLLEQCRIDPEARTYFLRRAEEAPKPPLAVPDDRRFCTGCGNLGRGGLCLAARRGEIVASRNYRPAIRLPRRCKAFVPKQNDQGLRQHTPGLPGTRSVTALQTFKINDLGENRSVTVSSSVTDGKCANHLIDKEGYVVTDENPGSGGQEARPQDCPRCGGEGCRWCRVTKKSL